MFDFEDSYRIIHDKNMSKIYVIDLLLAQIDKPKSAYFKYNLTNFDVEIECYISLLCYN